MKNLFIQVCIILFSGSAIFLLNVDNRFLNGIGAIVGLLGQPFWFYSTLTAKPFQWGIFALVCAYTVAYILGVYNFIL